MRFIAGMDKWISDWVAERLPGNFTGEDFTPCVAIGLMDKGELIAGCVYSNYRPGAKNIELSFAADTPAWATRSNIKSFLAYPYLQLGCNRVTAIIDSRNINSLKFVNRLGMNCEGRMRRAMDGVHDAVIYGMLFDECKWFEKELRNGKISTKTA